MLTLAAIGSPYIPAWTDLRPFVADLWLIATVVAVLLTPFFTRRSNAACALVTLAGLGLALLSLLLVRNDAVQPAGRLWPMLVSDHVAFLWKVMLLLFVMGIVLMWF